MPAPLAAAVGSDPHLAQEVEKLRAENEQLHVCRCAFALVQQLVANMGDISGHHKVIVSIMALEDIAYPDEALSPSTHSNNWAHCSPHMT